ncbi:MAG: tetratricopeptide repeat protein [Sphingomicrobium sp.]|nr:hypothetical protein [Sphingomonadales bacterium]
MVGLLASAASAAPRRPEPNDLLRTYVAARTAEAIGDETRAATLFASLAAADPADPTIAQRALERAIVAGDMPLALKIARVAKGADLSLDARLLLVADDLRGGRVDAAVVRLQNPGITPDLSFLAPFVRAWDQAAHHDPKGLDTLAQVSVGGPLGPFLSEQRGLMLAALHRTAEAEPFAKRALATAGGREQSVRLEMAEAFRAAGDRQRAGALLDGSGRAVASGRKRLAENRSIAARVDTPASAFAEILLGLAIGLNRDENGDLPVALAQVARHAAPDNREAAIVLGLLLDQADRTDDALAAFASVPRDDLLLDQARDATARTLLRAKRNDAALALVRNAASARDADAGDYLRLGDVLDALGRHGEAADAYLRAIAMQPATAASSSDSWTPYLLAASSLELAGRWPEARAAVEKALTIAPDQPLLLNFLGYAKLTHGEDIDAAEAMIRKASALRPSDSSITDSLGWALFKRGKLREAIATLEKAAAGDPAQSEIGEHLGDALYTAGRRFEARFAWRAALVTAENRDSQRIAAKIDRGLEPATAAP